MDCSTRRTSTAASSIGVVGYRSDALLDEASRGRTYSDDQIGPSLSVERREIFDK
jgi:hypothetical protein